MATVQPGNTGRGRESAVLNDVIRTIGTRRDLRIWRANAGAAKLKGRLVTFGIPGQADLTGITHDGRRLEIECKSATGRQSEAQRMFARIIESMNGIYILVRSGSDAEEQLASRGYPRKA